MFNLSGLAGISLASSGGALDPPFRLAVFQLKHGNLMRLKRSLILTAAGLVVAAVLVVCLAPVIVASGLRFWAYRVARREGLRVEIGQIEAPFLRPVTVRNLRVVSGPGALFQIDCAVARVELELSLAGIFAESRRPLRKLSVEGVTLDVRRNSQAPERARPTGWSVVENLLSDNFKFSAVNLHVENGGTTVEMRDGTLTGSELEAGIFTAREMTIASPWFQKTLSNLRGATSWQESRLTLGALSLIRGLDLDTITVDLSQIGQSRIGMEVNLDAFAGKIRARVSSDDRGDKRTWDVAGNASGISLAQMSDALEWTSRASGSLHTSKFTFRGEMNDLRNATAALWAEVSGLTWRDRTADTVMIGASLYNRAVQIEQLYIKQHNNQLTLSGEFGWPENSSDGIKPAFRGDLTASINDLGDFARLFGWSPTDFAGKLAANGSVSALEGKVAGQLSVSGNSLVLFRSPIESLEAKLGLEESRLKISQLEVRQKDDFFRGEGDFAINGDHSFNAKFQTSVAEIANYRGFIPEEFLPFPLEGSVAAEWKGRGANGSGSGTFHTRGRDLRFKDAALIPFEAELEADYSPGNIFFRQFHLWNPCADLSAFITVASGYVQLQTLLFNLNGRPRLQGDVYLPLSLEKIRRNSGWLAAFAADPFFDVDLALDATDLGELSAALRPKPNMSGQVNGRFELSGTPASLQGNSEFHLRDFVLEGAPALSVEIEAGLGLGMANFKANAAARGSNPVRIEGVLPMQLGKLEMGYGLKTEGPLSITANFPAIFLAKLPGYLSPGVFTRGILSGNLTISDSLQHPLITGDASLIDGQLLRGTTFSTGLSFKGRNAIIDFVRLKESGADVSARGGIDFRDLGAIEIKLAPTAGLVGSGTLDPGECIGGLEFSGVALRAQPSRPIHEIDLTGSLSARTATISFPSPDVLDSSESFSFCFGEPGGKTLTIQIAPLLIP